jgi:hypothetical protein
MLGWLVGLGWFFGLLLGWLFGWLLVVRRQIDRLVDSIGTEWGLPKPNKEQPAVDETADHASNKNDGRLTTLTTTITMIQDWRKHYQPGRSSTASWSTTASLAPTSSWSLTCSSGATSRCSR